LLRPVIGRAPSSDAALELGLLQQLLGRPDAAAILDKVAPLAETSDDPVEVARGARALRARALPRSQRGLPARDARRAERCADRNRVRRSVSRKPTRPKRSSRRWRCMRSKWAPALVGAARALADDNPPQAVTFATRARRQPLVGRRARSSWRVKPPTPTSTTRRGRRSTRRWR
jgi:hypothetical protein